MTFPRGARRLMAGLAASAGLAGAQAQAQAQTPLNLETLTAKQAADMLDAGTITSVQLTQAYIDRINALNKSGPGLNAVTQFNRNALAEAAATDAARAAGQDLGPSMGLPILVKDIVDAKPMYTSAGNYSLRNSFPAEDSGIVKKLRANGVVILGKLGLSEFANSFGNQPSGFSNLTGQVINGIDADQNPSGSSSGTGSAGAAALSALTIGTETSGSIISPSNAQSLVGIRPTIGLVPPYGIAPIIASQDTAGPMDRSVTAAAMTLQAIAGPDPKSDAEYNAIFGPNYIARGIVPQPPATVPDYLSALSLNYVQGKRIGYRVNATTAGAIEPGSPLAIAIDALRAAGATVVEVPAQVTQGNLPAVPTGYEQHLTIDEYYKGLGPDAPIKNLVEEVADNIANSQEALKFGNATHAQRSTVDITPGGPNEQQFRQNLPPRKQAFFKSIDDMLKFGTPNDTSDDVIAILGSVNNGPAAGYPQLALPMGYNATQRRAINVQVHGGAYSERDLIGVGYVIEQATQLRQPASMVNPSMYRCADTVPAPPFAARGACNPEFEEIMSTVGARPELGFPLELESAQELQERMTDGTLTSEALTKAFLSRIALSNAEGPATQAVRSVDLAAIDRAKALDAERLSDGRRGPLHGIPVLLDDSIDVLGTPTTAGSIALQGRLPNKDSTIVNRLKRAGAVILGKTNVTELNGVFDVNLPDGYSSLGGQVLVPSDTDKTPAGSSAGSAAATASGLAALTIGLETSPDTAQLVNPAAVAGVVGLKPTVGRISRTGVLGVARSQDAPGPITKTVADAAAALQVLAFRDGDDGATATAPQPAPDYTAVLDEDALRNKRIGTFASNYATNGNAYAAALSGLAGAGGVAVTRAFGSGNPFPANPNPQPVNAPSPNPPSIVSREFKRDANAYLTGSSGGSASTVQGIIDYNAANPVEGLKYQQGELTAAQAVDLGDPATLSAYQSDRDNGKASNAAIIDGFLNNGTPADTTDDVEALMVPMTVTVASNNTTGTTTVANPLLGYADRAGYPVLTVPAGYGVRESGAGRNPIGVAFIGTAYDEAELLADGHAFELQTDVRQAPSFTNPSMWRCVPGSDFFSPHHCHPGDQQFKQQFLVAPSATVTPTPTATPTVTPTATVTPGDYYYGITKRKRPGLKVKVTPKRDKKSPFRFTAKGKVILPKGVGKRRGCKGSVRFTLRRKGSGKPLSTTRKSVKKNCTFKVKTSFKKGRLKKSQRAKGKLRAQVRFQGNAVLKAKKITKQAAYGRK